MADGGVAVVEIMLNSSSSAQMTASVEHKNSEDSDSGASTLVSLGALTTVGVHDAGFAGAKEFVRYKLVLTSLSQADEWVHCRVLSFIWKPN